jgi:alpha-1,2-mannosyltransferase
MKSWPEERTVRLLILVLAAVALVLLVQTFHKAYRLDGYDFTPRLAAARALIAGTDPYHIPTPFPLTYPLFICVALLPLAWLPYWLANFLWFCAGGVCLWYSLGILLKAYVPGAARADFLKLFTLCVVLLLDVVQNNFANGQVNFLVLALAVLFFKFLMQKRPHPAGLFLAAAISLKLTPLLFAVYLLLRKEWKAAAWTVFYALLFMIGLPLLVGGPAVFEYYRGYLSDYIGPGLSSHPAADLSRVFYLSAYLGRLLDFPGGFTLNLVSAGLVLAPLAFLNRKAGSNAERPQALLFSGYLLAILLILPLSETHHLAFLAPAAMILTRYFLWNSGEDWWKRIPPLALIYLPLWLGKLSFVAYFLGIGVCYFLLLRLLWKERPVRNG